MRSDMASMESAPRKLRRVLEEQQSLLNSEPVIEIFEVSCKHQKAGPGLQFGLRHGLRHRSKKITMEYDVVSDNDQEQYLLGDQFDTSSQSGLKDQHGFAKCVGKYLNACKLNVNTLIGRKRRREAKSEKSTGDPQNRQQQDLDGADSSEVPCLGRGWKRLRRKLGEMIKIEEEMVTSVPRSVLYYA